MHIPSDPAIDPTTKTFHTRMTHQHHVYTYTSSDKGPHIIYVDIILEPEMNAISYADERKN